MRVYRIKSNGFSWCVQKKPWAWWPFWIYVKEKLGPEEPIRVKYFGCLDSARLWVAKDKKYVLEHCAKWKVE